tara:strand:- start:2365 stop:2913 length:549 start_codon:yes stop_codon:yes gene_type:complete
MDFFKLYTIFKFCYNLNIPFERLSLLSLCLLFLLLDKKLYNDYIFISFISFFSSIVIFSNFPIIVTWNNEKPIYYEDLYIDLDKLPIIQLEENQKNTYKKTYTRTLIISNSILISILICYWKFRTENTGSLEMMGVTGGILQIASMFNIFSGRIILFLIKKFINTKIYCDSNNTLHHDEPCV